MKIIYNNVIPFKGFAAINLFGVIFARKECRPLSKEAMNHEAIHTEQMKDLLYIGFYLCYVVEWLVRLFMKGNAYCNLSFEKKKSPTICRAFAVLSVSVSPAVAHVSAFV